MPFPPSCNVSSMTRKAGRSNLWLLQRVSILAWMAAGLFRLGLAQGIEVTACLHPNPDFSATIDQLNPFWNNPYATGAQDCHRPLSQFLPLIDSSYPYERRQSVQKGTAIAAPQEADLERNLLWRGREVIQ